MSSSIDNFFSDPEFMFHVLLQIFVTEQQAVTTPPAARRGVGDAAPRALPANLVPLALHQGDKLLAAVGVEHTVVDEIHELQLLALTTGSRVVLADGHGLRFLPGILCLEHRERKFHTYLVVTLAQFLELLLCDVEFPARVEVD